MDDSRPADRRRRAGPSTSELELVREAIALVAARGVAARRRRRACASARHCSTRREALAAEAGVRIVPLWMPDDAGADIAVERIADA